MDIFHPIRFFVVVKKLRHMLFICNKILNLLSRPLSLINTFKHDWFTIIKNALVHLAICALEHACMCTGIPISNNLIIFYIEEKPKFHERGKYKQS